VVTSILGALKENEPKTDKKDRLLKAPLFNYRYSWSFFDGERDKGRTMFVGLVWFFISPIRSFTI
jgi:hypothetical protein